MHHLVFDAGDLRVLDVQIRPGRTTQYHTHDAAIAYVPIGTSPSDNQPLGGEWEGTRSTDLPRFSVGIVTWNLGYASAPHTHRVRNVGDRLFRLIAVVNHGPGATDPEVGSILGGPADGECRWFRARRIVLAPGARVAGRNGAARVVLVQVSPGLVHSTKGAPARLDRPGSFVVMGSGSDYALQNAAEDPVTLVAVEVRATITPTPTPAIRSGTSRPGSGR